MTRALLVLALASCGDLEGFSGDVPPLATFHIEVTGTPADPPHHLQAALVWGMQWLPEALCVLPPESPEAAAAIEAGCRDPFGFVPLRVATNLEVEAGGTATLELFSLPSADDLVGDLTARVAYANVIVYDDRDDNGTLALARPNRLGGAADQTPTDQTDVVLGASFLTMTAPDQRIAYREGVFNAAAAFYPRLGCGDPLPAFSVLAASGFSRLDAFVAALAGKLPEESDLSQCVQADPADRPISIALAAPGEDAAAACTEARADSSVRYREPMDPPDLTDRTSACVHLPSFGGNAPTQIELIISGRAQDACKGLTHYILTGCRQDPSCGSPDWDLSQSPPAWWPCPPS